MECNKIVILQCFFCKITEKKFYRIDYWDQFYQHDNTQLLRAQMLWCSPSIWPTKNYAQLYQYTQQEVTTTFYIIDSMLSAGKISKNLLVQKLLIERWWNWHLDCKSFRQKLTHSCATLSSPRWVVSGMK